MPVRVFAKLNFGMNDMRGKRKSGLCRQARGKPLARSACWALLALHGLAVLAAPVSAAAHGYTVDDGINSQNQDLRIRTLVLHYTAEDLNSSLRSLTQSQYQVSAHYLVPQGNQASHVYQLVPDQHRAWHAGVSQWRGVNNINFSSIGMEMVNLGFPAADGNLPAMQRHWYPYDDAQIQVVGQLAQNLVQRYQLKPYQVVGHSDIAPGRKSDPGPLFPWQQLYQEYGVGAWPDPSTVQSFMQNRPYDGNVAGLQAKLSRYGYQLSQSGQLDQATANVIQAFQMHFRPASYDGRPDVETVAILDALLAKYFPATHSNAKQATRSMRPPAADDHEKGDEP